MRGSRKVCHRGYNFDNIFFFSFFLLVDEKRNDSNITISMSSSDCQRNAIYMAFRWRADVGPRLNSGLKDPCFFRDSGPVFLRNPIFL